jgi:hypothetical protein
VDHIDSVETVALAKQAIIGRGDAASLGVTKIDRASFKPGLLFDELGERFGNT